MSRAAGRTPLQQPIPRFTRNTAPNLVGNFVPGWQGEVVWPVGASTAGYYRDGAGRDKYTLVADPQCQNVTTAQNLRVHCTL